MDAPLLLAHSPLLRGPHVQAPQMPTSAHQRLHIESQALHQRDLPDSNPRGRADVVPAAPGGYHRPSPGISHFGHRHKSTRLMRHYQKRLSREHVMLRLPPSSIRHCTSVVDSSGTSEHSPLPTHPRNRQAQTPHRSDRRSTRPGCLTHGSAQ
jgi:hypothetical protein